MAIYGALEPAERKAAKDRMSEGGKVRKVSTPSSKTRDKLGVFVDSTELRRHVTPGQRAMAVAMISPEPKKLKRKQNAINGDHGVVHQRVADARAVLAYSLELAEAVMRDGKPLQAALAETRLSQGSVLNERARLAKLRDERPDLAEQKPQEIFR